MAVDVLKCSNLTTISMYTFTIYPLIYLIVHVFDIHTIPGLDAEKHSCFYNSQPPCELEIGIPLFALAWMSFIFHLQYLFSRGDRCDETSGT